MEYNEAKGPMTLFQYCKPNPTLACPFFYYVKRQTIIMSSRSNFKQTRRKANHSQLRRNLSHLLSKSFLVASCTQSKQTFVPPLNLFSLPQLFHILFPTFFFFLTFFFFSCLDQNKRKWSCFLERRYQSAEEHQSSKRRPLVPPFYSRRIVPSFSF